VLAAQVPADIDAPPHKVMRDLAFSPQWRSHFAFDKVREWHVHKCAFYYDVLSAHAKRIELWQTEYIHVMPDAESIAEWYRGSGMRPFLDVLPDDDCRDLFMRDYVAALRDVYPSHPDGRVLFPFRRLFLIAHR
jgi:trans-aconitate 2-methyltransferase